MQAMLRFLPLAAALLVGTPALAAFQNLEALDRQVAIALGADIGAPGGAVAPVDRRLRLAACPQPPVIEPGLAGTVTVRCPALGWRLRVLTAGGTARAASGMTPAQFSAPFRMRAEPVVRRGDPVQMTVETDSFAVTLEAVAEQDGAPGDRIRVHGEDKSGARVAEVVEAGRVRIAGFK